MKVCTFCGGRTENSTKVCSNCGSQQFLNICPNCSSEFSGSFCPTCGTRYDAPSHVCPKCNRKYYSKACPNCGYIQGSDRGSQYGYRKPSILDPDVNNRVRVAFFFSVFGLFTLPIPLSIIAIYLGVKEKKAGNTGPFVTTSIVVGIVGTIIGSIYFIAIILSMIFSLLR